MSPSDEATGRLELAKRSASAAPRSEADLVAQLRYDLELQARLAQDLRSLVSEICERVVFLEDGRKELIERVERVEKRLDGRH